MVFIKEVYFKVSKKGANRVMGRNLDAIYPGSFFIRQNIPNVSFAQFLAFSLNLLEASIKLLYYQLS